MSVSVSDMLSGNIFMYLSVSGIFLYYSWCNNVKAINDLVAKWYWEGESFFGQAQGIVSVQIGLYIFFHKLYVCSYDFKVIA